MSNFDLSEIIIVEVKEDDTEDTENDTNEEKSNNGGQINDN